ncbi:MAG TPA: acetamidase/formamidase family protein [Actinomycetota bacterium]|nr:acetamidase/formamidase family protein [Actinomycetota bacterium]
MADVNVVSYRPDRSEYAWTFGGVEPVMKVHPGDVLELWTEDCFGGLVQTVDDLPSEKISAFNPQTGPFHVEGAEPGDTLVLHFVSIEPSRDWAVSTTFPLFGALTSTLRTVTLQDPLPEIVWRYDVDRSRRLVRFEARNDESTIELPLEPMHGTVGVAPAGREARSSLVPDAHGGNMDTPEMRAGTTCYLGVNVEGALFSIGDGHCRQGEGETCGVAVEAAMDTVLIVELIKGALTPWPRLEDDTYIMSTGSARPLEDAFRIAHGDLVHWLAGGFGLDKLDAYQLVSQISESPVANVCDPNYTFVAKAPKRFLPGPEVYDGARARLKEMARAYRAERGLGVAG